MSAKKQIAINMVAQFISFFINVSINFFLTPYVTAKVGTDVYGFVNLAFQTTGYINLLTTALNSADRNSLLEFVNKRNKFYVHGVKNGFVICILSKDDAEEPISWDPLVSSTLPSALLESIYQKIGYLESHPKPVTKAKVDEFCLADVFKLIAVS